MRQYLFRGKRVDNREWVEGFLVVYRERPGRTAHFIIEDVDCNESASTAHLVLPETVGQWTGLHDKNKARIWEGDIITDERGSKLEITWGEGEWLAGELALNANLFVNEKSEFLEVIGNRYEHPISTQR